MIEFMRGIWTPVSAIVMPVSARMASNGAVPAVAIAQEAVTSHRSSSPGRQSCHGKNGGMSDETRAVNLGSRFSRKARTPSLPSPMLV